jgi:D-alanine--D-alanine ligase
VEASLQALREKFPGRRLVVVFQPHLYSRTSHNIPEFADALSAADLVIITDIYPAREDPLPGVSAVLIGEKISQVPHLYVPSRHLLSVEVKARIQDGDVVVGMGAGTIGEFAPALIRELKRAGKPRVLVVSGGFASEREVSLHSGKAVADAVQRLGYPLMRMDPAELTRGKEDISRLVGPDRPDCALLPIHGRQAEDGPLQGLLELLGIPYCGSGILASCLAMDKQKTKDVFARHGIDVPRGALVTREDLEEGRALSLVQCLCPAVVKPNREGSTVGLSFVEEADDLLPAIERALAYDKSCLVEEWLRGVEISCPVLGDRALLPVEIAPKSGKYDFASKYTPGRTEEPCPPPSLTSTQIELAQQIALQAHQALECRGVTRTDMIVTQDRIVALEINTLPGMTPTSLVPISAKADGMTFDHLVEWMIQNALSA